MNRKNKKWGMWDVEMGGSISFYDREGNYIAVASPSYKRTQSYKNTLGEHLPWSYKAIFLDFPRSKIFHSLTEAMLWVENLPEGWHWANHVDGTIEAYHAQMAQECYVKYYSNGNVEIISPNESNVDNLELVKLIVKSAGSFRENPISFDPPPNVR